MKSAGLDRLCTQNNTTSIIVSMIESSIILSNGLILDHSVTDRDVVTTIFSFFTIKEITAVLEPEN
jgi:hypothetical protein